MNALQQIRLVVAATVLALVTLFAGCNSIEVYEKNVSIPKYNWLSDFKPSYKFTITDTTSDYALFLVLRHTDQYQYNNIWINLGTLAPGDSMRYQRFDIQLGTDSEGWKGTGMSDIWEMRASITKGPFRFKQTGDYEFNIAHIMRENPLPGIMSAGIRVEKVK
jgi:gliding motility-associated lipoprotein GldH